MPDETTGGATTATDPTATSTPATSQAPAAGGGLGGGGGGGGLGGGHGRGTPAKLPTTLHPGDRDPIHVREGDAGSPWVSFLQQMLNYFYQSEVCNDTGEFDWLTARAVSHFREQQGLGSGDTVDVEFWKKLGIEDAPEQTAQQGGQHGAGHQQGGGQHGAGQHGADAQHGGGQHGGAHQQGGGHQEGGGHQQGQAAEFATSDYNAALVDLPDSSMSWAASLAMMLNSKGYSYTVDTLCDHVQATKEQKSWSDASQIGVNQGLFWVSCYGNTAEAWGAALQNGLLWVPNPTNDTHMFVVAGIRNSGDQAEIHVLDAQHGNDVWVSMHDFTEYYGMNDGYQGQLLAIT